MPPRRPTARKASSSRVRAVAVRISSGTCKPINELMRRCEPAAPVTTACPLLGYAALRRSAVAAPHTAGPCGHARRLLFVLVTSTCLAISALYELIEWGAAEALGAGATDFLGTQGDPFDTQKDMFCAWLGAMTAQWLLARLHDRQLGAMASLPSR